MFTGLVQAVGRIERRGAGLVVSGCSTFAPLHLGDSVAVDGVCLTVAALVGDGFLANVSEETLNRSTLGRKAVTGGSVNLEPALRLSDRLGGHLVSGHVDSIGQVMAIESLSQSWHLEVRWRDAAYGRYICEKASVAINGISLTVAGCADAGVRFWIAVIPHTWTATALRDLVTGDEVNLEIDLLARYTERLLGQTMEGAPAPMESPRPMSAEWLASQGWS
ncbi:MAG: riboflavin synthase [Propionibacteriaceae bacterium]|jgi:riboflavin synthase|nr:riboflavin synthase [Propionibacteriaceae bacterium]MBT65840.1 riboflavin synthase [Synechococcus sp. NP17]|tara:strand:+ start:26514 stop:27176 length:663 start_codon:yes stop_codon:yes gene_type:complete